MAADSGEILYGVHPVREAIEAGRREIDTLYLTRETAAPRLESIVAAAERRRIAVKTVRPEQLKGICRSDQHQGIAARVGRYPLVDLESILAATAQRRPSPHLLLLDSIVDPQNLGALVRTAVCAGMDGVVIPRDRSASPTPAVSRASAGALERVRLARVVNLVNALKTVKASGFWVVGLAREAGSSIFATDLTGPLALVVGGEEKGLRPLVRQHCDHLAAIPQAGSLDSLNASVAGAVAIYEAYRQRAAAGGANVNSDNQGDLP